MNINAFEMNAHRDSIVIGLLEEREEGLAEGAYKNRLETAKILLEIGLSIAQISKATDFSISEIEKL